MINEEIQEDRNYTETGIYSQDRVDISVLRKGTNVFGNVTLTRHTEGNSDRRRKEQFT